MSDYARRRHNSGSSGTTSGSSTSASASGSNSAAIENMSKEQVVVYLTQNSVTHHNDEIPETLAALQQADSMGLGKKSMIPISDPFKDGHKTDQYAFGASKAATMTWWHDDSSLESGQVRIGDRVLTLGVNEGHIIENSDSWSSNVDVKKPAIRRIRKDWKAAMTHVGLSSGRADAVIRVLMTGNDGTAKLMHSGGGACNELLQLIKFVFAVTFDTIKNTTILTVMNHSRHTLNLVLGTLVRVIVTFDKLNAVSSLLHFRFHIVNGFFGPRTTHIAVNTNDGVGSFPY